MLIIFNIIMTVFTTIKLLNILKMCNVDPKLNPIQVESYGLYDQ